LQVDLRGRVALVTGAAGAIGSATVERLSANGASVAVADINAEGAEAVAARLPNAIPVPVDISNEAQVEAAIRFCLAAFGRLDVLVNNAGVNTFENRVDIDQFAAEEWHRIVGVDLDGLYLMSRAAAKPMISQGGGRIVNVASVVGITALRLQCAFAAAKAAVIHLTRAIALELGPKGIFVNSIAPGSVISEGTRRLFYEQDGTFHDRAAHFMKHVPLGRPATPEEIAAGILFLSAFENSYMTGHTLVVDGGWTSGFMFGGLGPSA
jgi:NAD(P)-dependent dehydrogenase (short-subunit alcohol dehydrogenase family)